MPDTDAYAQGLRDFNPLRESVISSAIRDLQFPKGSRGLDAGCGIGLPTLLLAEAVGPTGHVHGVDLSPELLAHAGRIIEEHGLSRQISFHEGDVNKLQFDDKSFDWAWSMDCVGYHPSDPLPPLRELARVVKPGGSVAILAWSSQQLLPGYPMLEARLNATSAGIAPFVKGKKPEMHFLCALGWFHDIGLERPVAKTFVGDAYAPLSDDARTALLSLFQMRWGSAKPEVLQDDWEEFQRLCQPDSPDFILNRPDYYAFFTYSMFHGRVAYHT